MKKRPSINQIYFNLREEGYNHRQSVNKSKIIFEAYSNKELEKYIIDMRSKPNITKEHAVLFCKKCNAQKTFTSKFGMIYTCDSCNNKIKVEIKEELKCF